MPNPPTHCIHALENKNVGGFPFRVSMVLKPVVVTPDIVSNSASSMGIPVDITGQASTTGANKKNPGGNGHDLIGLDALWCLKAALAHPQDDNKRNQNGIAPAALKIAKCLNHGQRYGGQKCHDRAELTELFEQDRKPDRISDCPHNSDPVLMLIEL